TTNTVKNSGAVINACTTDPTACQAPLPTVTRIPRRLLLNDLSGQLVPYDTLQGPLLVASSDLMLMGPLLVSSNTEGRNTITSTTDLIGVTAGATLLAILAAPA